MSPQSSILVAVPKPARAIRARKPLRRVNARRRRAALAEDFGDLADVVRTLPCCVAGCARGPSDPAHVRSRGAGHHAWITIDGVTVGNLAPLCRTHHDEQGRRGVKPFEAAHKLIVRWPAIGLSVVAADLAEVAAIVGHRVGASGGAA